MATWREETLRNLANLDVEKVRHYLRWDDVELKREGGLCTFYARPSNLEWPSIDIGFDTSLEYVQHVGFHHWHTHFESFQDERRNVLRAFRCARQIICGARILCEESDAKGRPGGHFVKSADEVGFLWKDSVRLVVLRFNAAPEEKAIRLEL